MKFKFDLFVLGALVAFLLFVFLASRSQGETIETFDSPTNYVWSNQTTSVTPSGETFLGPFGNETVSVVLPMPEGYHRVLMDWEVYAIGDWPPVHPASWYVREYLASDGTTRLMDAASLLGYSGTRTREDLGYVAGDRTYGFHRALTGDDETEYRVEFQGVAGSMQWGLDNVRVYVTIPEPSTFVLIVAGLVGACILLISKWRSQ